MKYVFYSETLLFCVDLGICKLLYSYYTPYIVRETILRFTNGDISRLYSKKYSHIKFNTFLKKQFGFSGNNILPKSSQLIEDNYNNIVNIMNVSYKQLPNSKELATLHVVVPKYNNVKVVVPHKRDLGAIINYRITIFALIKQLYIEEKITYPILCRIMQNFVLNQQKIRSYFGNYNDDLDCKFLLEATKTRII